jgi:hypothetical protein
MAKKEGIFEIANLEGVNRIKNWRVHQKVDNTSNRAVCIKFENDVE